MIRLQRSHDESHCLHRFSFERFFNDATRFSFLWRILWDRLPRLRLWLMRPRRLGARLASSQRMSRYIQTDAALRADSSVEQASYVLRSALTEKPVRRIDRYYPPPRAERSGRPRHAPKPRGPLPLPFEASVGVERAKEGRVPFSKLLVAYLAARSVPDDCPPSAAFCWNNLIIKRFFPFNFGKQNEQS